MKYNKADIKKFAEECAKINTEMWNLICNCEELLSNPITKELRNNLEEDNKELLSQIHNYFMEVTDDEESIDTDLHSTTLSDVSHLISMIDKKKQYTIQKDINMPWSIVQR
jgi:flagellar hook-associated protein FlgK